MTTLSLVGLPRGSGLTVTVPLRASSRTVAEIVVLIGTPSLLKEQIPSPKAGMVRNIPIFIYKRSRTRIPCSPK